MTALVLRQDIDGIAVLTLNRPDKLNALNVPLFQELYEHAKDIENTPETIGCVVIKGAGRCFSAGHDLGDIATVKNCPDRIFRPRLSRR